jgi:hypothetical protein
MVDMGNEFEMVLTLEKTTSQQKTDQVKNKDSTHSTTK